VILFSIVILSFGTSNQVLLATEQNRETREGQSGLFPGSKQCENMAGIIEITKIPKRLNFQRIRVTWVIFLKAYQSWVKFQGALKLWVKFQNFSGSCDMISKADMLLCLSHGELHSSSSVGTT